MSRRSAKEKEAKRVAAEAEAAAKAAAEAVKEKRERRKGTIINLSVLALIIAGIAAFVLWAVPAINASQEAALQRQLDQMEVDVGIVNGQSYDIVVSDSLNIDVQYSSSVFLFVGSITSNTEEKLRIGYTSPNGDSYIVSIPVDRIKFHQILPGEDVEHGASFSFPEWRVSTNLQGNIDYQVDYWPARKNTPILTVNLTHDEFAQLVRSN